METPSLTSIEPVSPDIIWQNLQTLAEPSANPAFEAAIPTAPAETIDILAPVITADYGTSLGEDYIRVSVQDRTAGHETVAEEYKPWVFYILRGKGSGEDAFDILVPSSKNVYDIIAADLEQHQRAMSYLRNKVVSQEKSIEQ